MSDNTQLIPDKPKHPGGRPTKYKPEYCQAILNYFNIESSEYVKKTMITKAGNTITEEVERANSLPTIEGFANLLEVTTGTVVNWAENHEEFLTAYTCAKAFQKKILIDNGLKGLYNPQFAQFVATNCTDMKIKQEVAHTGADGKPLTIIVSRGADRPQIEEHVPDAELIEEDEH